MLHSPYKLAEDFIFIRIILYASKQMNDGAGIQNNQNHEINWAKFREPDWTRENVHEINKDKTSEWRIKVLYTPEARNSPDK